MSVGSHIYGQYQKSLQIEFSDAKAAISAQVQAEISYTDSISFISSLNKNIINLWANGYLTSNIDNIISTDSSITANVYIGEQYLFGDIKISDYNMAIIESAGLKNVRWKGKKISPVIIGEYAELLLTYMENNGYPFAKVSIDSTEFDNGKLSGILNLDRKSYVPFDSIRIIGDVNIRRTYINKLLNITKGDPYSRQKIDAITKSINELSFIQLDSTPRIKFEDKKAQVLLYLKHKKASRFDFIIGVLPTGSGAEKKFTITGDFTAEMQNALGHGEYIYARFNRLKPKTQELSLKFNYPYIFNLPLGIDTRFELFQSTTEFTDLVSDIGIIYQFDEISTLKASWTKKSSRLVEIDTNSIIMQKKLPAKLDVSFDGGALEYVFRNVDYRFNPSKGLEVKLNGALGLRRIIKNPTIEGLHTDNLDFILAYDSLKLNSLQTELSISAFAYIPTFKIGTIKIGINGGIQYNEEQLYDNQLYRLGGNKQLRGFDEQSILTDKYLVSTFEFRLLLDRNSYLSFPFIDYGVLHSKVDDSSNWDTAIGLGIGINFSTVSGIFNVAFATGRRLDNSFDFNNTKIHFGYVNLF